MRDTNALPEALAHRARSEPEGWLAAPALACFYGASMTGEAAIDRDAAAALLALLLAQDIAGGPSSAAMEKHSGFGGEGAWESNPPAPGAPTPTRF